MTMSLRDWFAGMALSGLLAHPHPSATTGVEFARDAYYAADAMLAHRRST